MPNDGKPNINYKWSTLEDRFRCGLENRIFDEYPVAASLSTDYLPMFSSFNKDNQFSIQELPGRKMEPELNQDENYSTIFSRRSQILDTLYKKKDNMFSRVSPNKWLIKPSKSSLDMITSPRSPKQVLTPFDDTSSKTISLLKKWAVQGIRASGFKN